MPIKIIYCIAIYPRVMKINNLLQNPIWCVHTHTERQTVKTAEQPFEFALRSPTTLTVLIRRAVYFTAFSFRSFHLHLLVISSMTTTVLEQITWLCGQGSWSILSTTWRANKKAQPTDLTYTAALVGPLYHVAIHWRALTSSKPGGNWIKYLRSFCDWRNSTHSLQWE